MAVETVDKIVANIKIIASVPLSQSRFTDDYIRYLIKRETDLKLYPLLVRQGQEYIAKTISVTTDKNGEIEVPDDAYLGTVLNVYRSDTKQYLYNAAREGFEASDNNYSFLGDVLLTHYKNKPLDITYVPEPRELVETASAPIITVVDVALSRVSLNAPTTLSRFDVISRSGKLIRAGVVKTGGSNSNPVLNSVEDIVAGQYLVAEGTTPVISFKAPIARFLERCVANCLLEEMQDTAQLEVGQASEEIMKRGLLDSLSSRGSGAQIIVRRRLF